MSVPPPPGPDPTASGQPAGPAANAQRERIVAAALDLLAETGAAGLTMRTIGARVGLHNSSLFHHFPAKREIVGAVLGRINDGLLERLAPLADDEPPALDRLVAVLSALSDHYATHRAEARCAMRLLLDPEGLLNERGSRFTTVLWSWLARAQAARVIRPVSVGHAARCLLGMVLMDPVWVAAARQPDRDDGRRRAELAAFVRGALAPST